MDALQHSFGSAAFFAACFLFQHTAPATEIDWPQLKLTEIATGANVPTSIASPSDGSGRVFITEQSGRVMLVQSNALVTFLDIQSRVQYPVYTEYGLLSVAFSPGFSSNRQFYVYYNRQPDGASTVSRFFVSATNANIADPTTEQIVLVVPKGAGSAYTLSGGLLLFGPEGYLHIGMGDSGFTPSTPNQAQNGLSMRGKILRIDVESSTNTYQIPGSNPFVGNTNYLPEIWASGVRNPWRFSFDRATADFYLGDVGQFEADEVNFKPAGVSTGQNYGWPIREGVMLYAGPDAAGTSLTDPILDIWHTELPFSVTGGFVSRSPAAARMMGMYFYADAYSGRIWGLKHDGVNWTNQLLAATPYFISTFGEDQAGQLYLADYISGGIYLVEDDGQVASPIFSPRGTNSYTEAISITCLSTNATIRYTTNGVDPSVSDPSISSGATVIISSGTNLKARAFRSGLLPSTTTSVTYSLKAARPVFSPPRGPITNGQSISISSLTAGATFRYTLDGSDPTAGSTLFTAPIAIYSTNILKARAFKGGFADSGVGVFSTNSFVFQGISVVQLGIQIELGWSAQTNWNYQLQVAADPYQWRDYEIPKAGIDGALSYFIGYSYPHPVRRLYRVKAALCLTSSGIPILIQ